MPDFLNKIGSYAYIKWKLVPTHDSDFQVRSSRVALIVPGHAGVGGCVLLALNVGDDQGAVGEDDLPVVEGKLAAV